MDKPGAPSVATGTITATGQGITASDEGGGSSEALTGLLETDADVVSGDSGGPLVDSSGQVVGMDTAASASDSPGSSIAESAASTDTTGYAIPITTALDIAKKIVSGDASSTIVIGTPGFLGVEVGSSTTGYGGYGGYGGYSGYGTPGASVEGVVSGSSAATIGLGAGDVITAVNGHSIASAEALSSTLESTHSGERVTVTWTDSSGDSHTATATLSIGPAA
jgi:S1-C subfamily serine protease